MIMSLLPAADRKSAVCHKRILRCRITGKIVIHILHPALFLAAKNLTHANVAKPSMLTAVLHCIQHGNCRSLIILYTTPDQITVFLCTFIRRIFPAISFRYNIEVIPDADLMHACTGCQAEAVAIHILTAERFPHTDLPHFLQHPAALRSKWCTRNIVLFRCHTWNFHQLRQILLHRRFLRSDPPPDLFSFVFFHRCLLLFPILPHMLCNFLQIFESCSDNSYLLWTRYK